LVALALPFEAISPLLATPWVALSDEKLVLLIAAAAWLCLGPRARPSTGEWRALRPSLALLVVALLAAVLAPAFRDEALRSVWRLAAAVFLLLLVVRVARDPGRRDGLLWAIILGGGASSLLGLGEASGWPMFGPLLSWFKVAPTRVGGELRVRPCCLLA
jgi:hypothetical protein